MAWSGQKGMSMVQTAAELVAKQHVFFLSHAFGRTKNAAQPSHAVLAIRAVTG